MNVPTPMGKSTHHRQRACASVEDLVIAKEPLAPEVASRAPPTCELPDAKL
jgi:hypothetical protein